MRFRFLVVGAISLLACATATLYYRNLEQLIRQQEYSGAQALVEEKRAEVYGEKDILLYWLDKGFLCHLSGDYAASNESFEEAKRLFEEYFTRSISGELSTLLISDNVQPYFGEDFERTLLNCFSALNYFCLGKDDEALVECRQADAYLQSLQTRYGFRNTYKEDIFARYLSGIIYEAKGEINDAYISYWQALMGYKNYPDIFGLDRPPQDLIDRTYYWAKKNFPDDLPEIRRYFSQYLNEKFQPATTEVIVIGYLGVAPVKIDNFFEISFGKGWTYVGKVAGDAEIAEINRARAIARSIAAEEQIRLAFPKYVDRPSLVQGLEIMVNEEKYPAAEVVDVGRVARKSLEDRLGRIYAKTIARAAIKYALSKEIKSRVEKQSGEGAAFLAGVILRAASTATELADKRCWQILPRKIAIARIAVAPGKYTLRADFLGDYRMRVMSKIIEPVIVKKGRKAIVILSAIM